MSHKYKTLYTYMYLFVCVCVSIVHRPNALFVWEIEKKNKNVVIHCIM